MKTVIMRSFLYAVIGLSVISCAGKVAVKESDINGIKDVKEFSIKRGSRISWGEKTFFDAPRFNDKNIEEKLDLALLDGLNAKGLKFTNHPDNSEYLLSYTLVLGEIIGEQESLEIKTADPDLVNAKDISTLEYGKLLLVFRVRETGELVWQNGVSDFASIDMPNDIRQQRLLKIVEILLDELPVSASSDE